MFFGGSTENAFNLETAGREAWQGEEGRGCVIVVRQRGSARGFEKAESIGPAAGVHPMRELREQRPGCFQGSVGGRGRRPGKEQACELSDGASWSLLPLPSPLTPLWPLTESVFCASVPSSSLAVCGRPLRDLQRFPRDSKSPHLLRALGGREQFHVVFSLRAGNQGPHFLPNRGADSRHWGLGFMHLEKRKKIHFLFR